MNEGRTKRMTLWRNAALCSITAGYLVNFRGYVLLQGSLSPDKAARIHAIAVRRSANSLSELSLLSLFSYDSCRRDNICTFQSPLTHQALLVNCLDTRGPTHQTQL